MKPNAEQIQIQKEDRRKRHRFDERIRMYFENLRHRLLQERKRRRKWLLLLLLALFESRPVQTFFTIKLTEQNLRQGNRKLQPSDAEKHNATTGMLSDDERRFLYDYAPRPGDEHLEVYDGLTHSDIVALNKIHRPWAISKFERIPGMPKRYADSAVHIWTLLDHLDSDYHRPQALEALKLIVDSDAHDWIDACTSEVGGLTYKDIRRQCRRRTPAMTIAEFSRSASRWREERRQEIEELKREARETPENGPTPPSQG
ncbi:hypothetical protein ACCS39_27385 [Rhizobium ruizarguesonis]